MVFKQLLHSAVLAVALLAGNATLAMESNNLTEQVQTADYEESRDLAAIEAIFESDWNRLEASRPYDPTLAKQCLEPWPIGAHRIKWMKVLRHHDKTIGFITYLFTPATKQADCEVGGIAPEYRKKGLAKHFLGLVIEDLKNRGASHVNLFVKKDNQIARGLYAKLGFEIVEEAFKGKAFSLRKQL